VINIFDDDFGENDLLMMIIHDGVCICIKWWWLHVYKMVKFMMVISCMNVCIWW